MRKSPKDMLEDFEDEIFGHTHDLIIAGVFSEGDLSKTCWFCHNKLEMEEQVFAMWMDWA